ncbi:MAG: metallophosphoesterase [Verrucomicrobiota bacterium]|jgi:predicted MPP superfamily phosphohydrolase
MKFEKISRRRFLLYSVLAAPGLAYAEASWVETERLHVRKLRLSEAKPGCRVVHFTDLHHKGDRAVLEAVVRKINALSPEVVCFTGDLVEHAQFLPEALEGLAKIKAPMYGVPGNHDYDSKADFGQIGRCFAATGGAWVLDRQTATPDGRIHISGATCLRGRPPAFAPVLGGKSILLMHYPMFAGGLAGEKYDLILAGHSHGGQVRLPFYGALLLPYWVGKYDLGLFRVPAGPLYVNPGIGWSGTPVRFNCRPEITVLEI